jgi:fibronectin-binding autotransporter adhesin
MKAVQLRACSLMAAAAAAFAVMTSLSSADGAILTWIGPNNDDLGNAANWNPNAVPNGVTPDTMQWDGTVVGPLLLNFNTNNGNLAGNPGLFINLTSGQTSSLTLDTSVAVPTTAIRLQGITIAAGAGAFSFGDGSGTAFMTNITNSPFTLTNNSLTTATINADCEFNNTGGGVATIAFAGSGNWTMNTGLTSLNNTGNSITKTGTGTVTLNQPTNATSDLYTGTTTITQGTFTVNAALGPTAITLNPAAGTLAVMNTSSTVTRNGGQATNIGSVAGGIGVLNITAGTWSGGSSPISAGTGGLGVINMSGGNVTPGQFLVAGINAAGAAGIWNITAGQVNISSGNAGTLGATAGTTGVVNISGAGNYTSNAANTTSGIYIGESGTGTLSMWGGGTMVLGGGIAASQGLMIGKNLGASGVVNLGAVSGGGTGGSGGGTITTNVVQRTNFGATGIFNFHGGTLQATSTNANAAFMTGLNSAYVWSEGGTVDNNGQSITIGQALLAPTGRGVSSLSLSGTTTGFTPGATPMVTLSGGGGTGATAIANVDGSGNLSLVITNPGTGYTSAPLVAFQGLPTGFTTAATATLNVANLGGGLTFQGAGGTTILAGNNTYTGATAVNSGTLAFASKQSNIGAISVADSANLSAKLASATSNLVNAAGNVTLGNNTLTFDFNSLTPTATTSFIAVGSGTLTTGSAGSLAVNILNTGNLSAGSYRLIDYPAATTIGGGGISAFPSTTFTNLGGSPRSTGVIQNDAANTAVVLSVTSDKPVWSGAAGGNWVTTATGSNAGAGNWALKGAHTATNFWLSDSVEFNDTYNAGAGNLSPVTTTATISSGNVSPSLVVFNNSAVDYTIAGTNGISGTGALVKNGTGAVTINSPNTYTGGTTFTGGTLKIGNAGALGNGPLTIDVGNPKTLDNSSAAAITLTTITSQSWNDDFTFTGSKDLDMGTSTVTLGGASPTRSITLTAGTLSIGKLLDDGTHGLTLSGTSGTLLLRSTAATADGGSNINVTLTVNAGAALQMNSGDLTVGGLTGGGIVKSGAGNRTLFVTNAADFTYTGALQNPAGTLLLTKGGAGTLTLTGTNTYTGATTVNGGKLVINGQNTGAGTATTINNASTLVLGHNTALGTAAGITFPATGTGTLDIALDGDTGAAYTVTGNNAGFNITILSDRATSGAAVNHTLGAFTLGGGTVTIGAGANVSGTPSISIATLNLNGGSTSTTTFNPTGATMSIAAVNNTVNNIHTLELGGTSGGNQITGVISSGSGTLNLLKSSSSTWTLSGANTYNGTTSLTGGTLNIGNAGTTGSLPAGAISISNAALNFNRTDTPGLALANAISGTTGSINQKGSGRTTLSGTSTFSGATNVSAGTLVVTGSLSSSPTTIDHGANPSATLDGIGSVGALTIANATTNTISNGTNAAGNATAAPLTVNGSLTFQGAATVNIRTSAAAASVAPASAITTAIPTTGQIVTGTVNNAAGVININANTIDTAWTSTTYNLLGNASAGSIGGAGFGSFNPTVSFPGVGLGTRQSASLVNNSGLLQLVISGNPIRWTGSATSNWTTTAGNQNWLLLSNSTATDFLSGDSVIFDDNSTVGGVTLVGPVSPGSVVVNNTNSTGTAYTFSGTGIISGSLTKSGTGSLTINTTNTYTGGTAFTGGTLNITTAGALGNGSLTIGSGNPKTLNNSSSGAIALSTVTSQAWNDDFTFLGSNSLDMGTGTVTLGGANGTRTITLTANSLSIGKLLDGGTHNLTLSGGGTLALLGTTASSNNINGTLTLTGTPTLQINRTGNSGANAGDLTVTGLTGGGTVVNGSTDAHQLIVNNATDFTFAGSLNNGGTGGLQLTKGAAGTLTLSGANSYTGATTVNAGKLIITGANSGAATAATLNNAATLVLGNAGALGTGAASIQLTATGTLDIALDADTGAATTYTLGATQGFNAVVQSDVATPGSAGINHSLGAFTLAGGTLTIQPGANVSGGSPAISTPGLNLNSGTAGATTILSPVNTNLSVTGASSATVSNTVGTAHTLQLDGTSTSNSIAANIVNGSAVLSLTKSNSSTWTLTGTNSYSGTTTLAGGTLNIGSGGLTGSLGTGPVNFTSNVPLNFNRTDTGLVVPGAISGTVGSINQIGSGKTSLSGTSTFSGATNVSNGTLSVTGSLLNSPITVNRGANASATLDGAGSVGTVIIANDAANTLANGNGGFAPLSIGTLTFQGAAAVNIRTSSALGGTTMIPTTTQVQANSAPGAVKLNLTTNDSYWVAGTYSLLGNSSTGSIGGSGGFNSFQLNSVTPFTPSLGTRQSASLQNSSGLLQVVVTGDPIHWTGIVNSNWTTGTIPPDGSGNKNWTYQGSPTDFLTTDVVVFDDGSSNGTVNIIDTDVRPAAVSVNNNGTAYVISGNPIAGTASLIKDGIAALTLNSANTYTGTTTLKNGTLNLGNSQAINTGRLIIGDLANPANNPTITNNGSGAMTLPNNPQTWNANFTFGGTNDLNLGTGQVTLAATPTVTISGTAMLTVGGAITGSGLGFTKDGPGTMTLTGTNTYTGATTVNAGTLVINGANSGAGTTAIVNTGTLVLGSATALGTGTSNIQFPVNSTGTLDIKLNSGVNVTYTVGTNTTSNATILSDLATAGAGVVHTLSAISLGGGTLTIEPGSNVTSGTAGISTTGATGNLNLNSGTAGATSTLIPTTNPTTTLPATMTITGTVSNTNGIAHTLILDGTTTGNLISGNIVDGNAVLTLQKANTSTWTLSGANTYTGTTTLSGGTLNIGSGGTTGSFGTGAISTDSTTVNFNRTDTALVVASAISGGSGSINQVGSGKTTLSSPNSTYSGQINVNNGTLAITGSLVNSPITVDRGANASATLDGTGSVGNVTVANSASNANTVANGNGGTAPLTLAGLTFNGIATAKVKTASPSAVGLAITGTMTTTPGNVVTLNATSGTGYWALGLNDLISFGAWGDSANLNSRFTLTSSTPLSPRQTLGALQLDGPNKIALVVNGDLINWTGIGAQTWTTATNDTTTPHDWALKSGHTQVNFLANDIVEFDDTYNIGAGSVAVTNSAVNVSGTGGVSPLAVVFNNSAVNYTVSSSSGVGIAQGGFTKMGSGNVTLKTTNTGTGALTINGGTLTLAGINAYTAPTVNPSGTLSLDFSQTSATSNLLGASQPIVLNGGTLNVIASTTGSNSQSFASTTLGANSGSAVNVTGSASSNPVVMALGTISRSTGSNVIFTLPTGSQGSNNGITTSTLNDGSTPAGGANGILGAWAVISSPGTAANGSTAGYTYARSNGTTGANNIVPYTAATNETNADPLNAVYGGLPQGGNGTINYDLSVTGSGSPTAAIGRNLNTLRNVAGGYTQGGGMVLTINGILNAGTGPLNIGHTLQVGTRNELVIDAASAPIVITGAITNNTGASTVDFMGPNTTTLSGVCTYQGATNVTSGTLLVNGAGSMESSSGININGPGAKLVYSSSAASTRPIALTQGTLDGTGSLGSVTVGNGSGGVITHGNGGTGALTMGNLTFQGAATANFNYGGSPGIIITGALTTTPASGKVTINPLGTFSNGANTLMTFGSFSGVDVTDFQLVPNTSHASKSLGLLSNSLVLNVTLAPLAWTGNLDGKWATSATGNNGGATTDWVLAGGANTTTNFWALDDVQFNNTYTINNGSPLTPAGTVTIHGGNVSPGSMVFNNTTLNYTIQSDDGSGISSGVLTLNGTGSVTLNTANSYTSGTNFNGGTLNLGNAAALGTGNLTIGTGSAKVLNNTSGAALVLSTSLIQAWNDDFAFAGSNDLDMGTGQVTMSGANATLSIALAGNKALSVGKLVDGGTHNLTLSGSGTLLISSTGVNTNGSTVGGNLTVGSGATLLFNRSGNAAANTGDLYVNGLAGSGTISANTGAGIARWLFVNNTSDNIFSGSLQDGGAGGRTGLSKSGTGTLTLNGASNYSDITTINAGTLVINGPNGSAGTAAAINGNPATLVLGNSSALGTAANIQFGATSVGTLDIALNAGSDVPYTVGANTGFTATILSNLASSGAGATHTLGAISLGGGSLTIGAGTNVTSGLPAISTPTLNLNGGTDSTTTISPTGAKLLIGAVNNTTAFNHILTLDGTSTGNLISGPITATAGTISLLKSNTSTWTLQGNNTYTGPTTINQGTLALGVANSIATTQQVILGGGTLATGGFAQAMPTTTLVLNANSSLDFGAANAPAAVSFANSSGNGWAGSLAVSNWTYGKDHLQVGTDNTGLSGTQLGQINFDHFQPGAQYRTVAGSLEVTPAVVVGDVNQDASFNIADVGSLMVGLTNVATLQQQIASLPAHSGFTASDTAFVMDVNSDGSANNRDLQAEIVGLANGGFPAPGGASLSAVPEPATIVLFGLGGLILVAGRIRNRRPFLIQNK